ncbi:MAG TPA: EscF/YscF/HrpA family type III secretion system needle major subunit [Geminicoccaceae bacterium]|nr:EscF/YscF/HrpA family type III secretion system needle major subunit [Geminicoccus sp.]HMU48205.1 EscF/YscF/HrpA family type III secretion system needle major subunit [Geminicoccaceae bacterium]
MAAVSGLTYDAIGQNLVSLVGQFESVIQEKMAITNPTTQDLFAMQVAFTQYTTFVSTQSGVLKAFGDELKSIIQKI